MFFLCFLQREFEFKYSSYFLLFRSELERVQVSFHSCVLKGDLRLCVAIFHSLICAVNGECAGFHLVKGFCFDNSNYERRMLFPHELNVVPCLLQRNLSVFWGRCVRGEKKGASFVC